MHRLSALVPTLAGIALAVGQPQAVLPVESAQPAPPTPVEDLSGLTTDDVIARLPPAGLEWRWEPARGDGVEDPASLEMQKRMAGGTLTDDQWQAVLVGHGALRLRGLWPKGEDYAVSMTVPRWLGLAQIRLRPRNTGPLGTGLDSVEAGELMMGISGTGAMMDARDARAGRRLGKLPEGVSEIVFDVDVERGKSWMADLFDDPKKKPPPPGVLWKGTITQPVREVASWEEAVPPVSGPDLEGAVRDAIGAGIREWGEGNQRFPFVLIDPDCAKYPVLATTGLDIRVELLKDNRVLAESWLVASNLDTLNVDGSISHSPVRFYGSANVDFNGNLEDTAGWTLRLAGESRHVEVLWDAKQRWAGTITIPWSEAMAHEAQRVGPAGRGPACSVGYWK